MDSPLLGLGWLLPSKYKPGGCCTPCPQQRMKVCLLSVAEHLAWLFQEVVTYAKAISHPDNHNPPLLPWINVLQFSTNLTWISLFTEAFILSAKSRLWKMDLLKSTEGHLSGSLHNSLCVTTKITASQAFQWPHSSTVWGNDFTPQHGIQNRTTKPCPGLRGQAQLPPSYLKLQEPKQTFKHSLIATAAGK